MSHGPLAKGFARQKKLPPKIPVRERPADNITEESSQSEVADWMMDRFGGGMANLVRAVRQDRLTAPDLFKLACCPNKTQQTNARKTLVNKFDCSSMDINLLLVAFRCMHKVKIGPSEKNPEAEKAAADWISQQAAAAKKIVSYSVVSTKLLKQSKKDTRPPALLSQHQWLQTN